MLAGLLSRGEELAGDQLQKKVTDVAAQLRAIVGNAAVSVEDARVVISGRGIVKRWLTDPTLRFLTGAVK
jgi:predicted NBD/HSP70 family sugar kinase